MWNGSLRYDALQSDRPRGTGGRRGLIFSSNGEEVGKLGVTGGVSTGLIDLRTEIWHRSGTDVESIRLRVWMPSTETGAGAGTGTETGMETASPAQVAVRRRWRATDHRRLPSRSTPLFAVPGR